MARRRFYDLTPHANHTQKHSLVFLGCVLCSAGINYFFRKPRKYTATNPSIETTKKPIPNPRRVDESSLRKSGTSGLGVGEGMGVIVRVGRGVTGVGESVGVRVGGRSVLVNVGVMVGVGARRIINFCPGNRIGFVPLRLFSLTNSSRSTPYASTIIHSV